MDGVIKVNLTNFVVIGMISVLFTMAAHGVLKFAKGKGGSGQGAMVGGQPVQG